MDRDAAPARHESVDDVVRDLRQLRSDVGAPSFAQIAQRITDRRIARGASEAAARVARTTVYDAFRLGRTRLDSALIGEIAAALAEDDRLDAPWARRARHARPSGAEDPPAAPAAAASATTESETPPGPPATPAPPPSAGQDAQPGSLERMIPRIPRAWVLPTMALCLALNLLGFWAVGWVPLPLYLDMVGTALAAIALGPWCAVVTAVLTHPLGLIVNPGASMALMPVNITGALVWGYGVHRWRMARTPARFLLLNVAAATACTVVATPLLLIFFDAGTGHTTDELFREFQAVGLPHAGAVFAGNLFTSLADKLVAGFIALGVASLLPAPSRGPQGTSRRPQVRNTLSRLPVAPGDAGRAGRVRRRTTRTR